MLMIPRYKAQLHRYDSDAYNLPFDTIYFIESEWNYVLNDFVRRHQDAIEEYLSDHYSNFLFEYKFRYVSRKDVDDIRALLQLHPEVEKLDGVEEKLRELRHRFSFSELREICQNEWHKKRYSPEPGDFRDCFLCHLLPSEADDADSFDLYSIDVEVTDEPLLLSVIDQYVRTIDSYNRAILESRPLDIEPGTPVNKEAHYISAPDKILRRYHERAGLQRDIFPPTACAMELPSDEGMCFSMPDREPDPDAELRARAQAILDDIRSMQRDNGLSILSELLGKDLIDSLRGDVTPVVSSLVVDSEYRILLPEYDREICLSTLPKALYILFLRHPEGLDRYCLDEHKEEFRRIYMTISHRGDMQSINKSIDDLLEPASDSLNQKISRINAAFRNLLAEDIAAHYIIAGPRGEAKCVELASAAQLPDELKF